MGNSHRAALSRKEIIVSLKTSRALWNPSHLDLRSNETLAQILDRGDIADWQELYQLAGADKLIRERIHQIVRTVPLPMPYFWLAALASLGEPVDFSVKLHSYADQGP